ncbi:MAG: ECF transporter S component [Bacillota bacterium]
MRIHTRTLIKVAMLAALAFGLMYLEFSVLPGYPFLQYDPGDVPALLGTFSMGPLAGALIQVIKCVIFFLSGKDEAGWIGTAANLVTGLSFVVPAGLAYWRHRTRAGAMVALAVGSLSMIVAMAAANYLIFLPLWGVPRSAALPMITGGIIPFNAIKAAISSVLTIVLYKRVRPLL